MSTTDHITTHTLRFERLLDAPREKVWQYLADPALRARWFMAGEDDLREGGHLGLTFDHARLSDRPVPTPEAYQSYGGASWSERILRCEPSRLLAFTWDGGPGGEVTIELHDADQGRTRLVLTHAGLRGRDDALDFGGGWHSHLAVLERRLRGEPVENFWALHAEAERLVAQALS